MCLARAFQPMHTPAARTAFVRDLPADLLELSAEAGYEVGRLVGQFAAHASTAEERLIEDYSALFLVPPVPAPLNAGLYLDGGLMGPGTLAMLQRYREAALEPDEQFRDLPDHMSMQLEYVAVMFARAADGDVVCTVRARRFLAEIVLTWIAPFTQALEAAAQRIPAACAYAALATILNAAARHETQPDSD